MSAPLCPACGQVMWASVSTGHGATVTPLYYSCPVHDGLIPPMIDVGVRTSAQGVRYSCEPLVFAPRLAVTGEKDGRSFN